MNRPIFAAFALSAAALSAPGADTLAFYPFTEGSDGESAAGKTVLNAVDNSLHAGTVQLKSSGTAAGGVVYSDDVPAKYVFDGLDGELICENPRSLLFSGDTDCENDEASAGGNVRFEGVGTELSACDGYTVEFFWKALPEQFPSSMFSAKWRAIEWNAGNVCTTKTVVAGSPAPVGVTLFETSKSMRLWAGATDGGNVNWYTASFLYDYSDTHWLNQSRTLLDGKWHHLAVTYDKATGQFRSWADYCVPDHLLRNGRSMVCTNVVLDSSHPLDLGCFRFRGRMACLRVTKRVLGKDEFLHVSNDGNFYPEAGEAGETVFHLRLDGENGTAVGDGETVTNLVTTYRDINPGLFYGTDRAIVRDGHGRIAVAEGGTAVWTNSLPDPRRVLVVDGTSDAAAVIGKNKGSLHIRPPDEYVLSSGGFWRKAACGVTFQPADYQIVRSGSFTCECYLRFDKKKWFEGNQCTNYPRVSIMGSANRSHSFDWKLMFDFLSSNAYPDETTTIRTQLNFYTNAQHKAMCYVYETINAGEPLNDGEWCHVAVVYDDSVSRMAVYIDGELHSRTDTLFTRFEPVASGDYLGRINFGHSLGDQTFFGEIDEVRYSRVALDPSRFLSFRRKKDHMSVFVR